MKQIAQANEQITKRLEEQLAGFMKPELIKEVALNIGLERLESMTIVELGAFMKRFIVPKTEEVLSTPVPRTRKPRTVVETSAPLPPQVASDGATLPSAPIVP